MTLLAGMYTMMLRAAIGMVASEAKIESKLRPSTVICKYSCDKVDAVELGRTVVGGCVLCESEGEIIVQHTFKDSQGS